MPNIVSNKKLVQKCIVYTLAGECDIGSETKAEQLVRALLFVTHESRLLQTF